MFNFIERRLLFKPVSPAQSWSEPPPELHAEDVWLDLPTGEKIHAWWCTPEGWRAGAGAVLYSQGYRGNLSQRAEVVGRWLKLLNRAVLVYDYPGYGHSTGKPGERACYSAAETAFDWIVHKGVSAEDVVLYGGSLGGAVAIETATRRPYRALVTVGAFTSIPDMAARQHPWLPVGPLFRNRFENVPKISKTRGRVFIAHGTADKFVPFHMAEKLIAAAPEPRLLFPMRDYEHFHTPGPEFYTELRRFLDQYPVR
jgi:fermentation-respiration switch protein FrsA (DUF1100 family)